MTNHILMTPANPGTALLEVSGLGVLKTPIIGWLPDAENHYRSPQVITPKGIANMKPGRAILVDGMVYDPRELVCFGSIDEWKVYADRADDAPVATAAAPASADDLLGTPAAPAATETPSAAPEAAPAASEGDLGIQWATKPLKNNSFYRYTEGELDFLFNVPGESSPPPKQVGLDGRLNVPGEPNLPPKQVGPITKIKRDEFMKLKKEMDVAEYDDVRNGIHPGMTPVAADIAEPASAAAEVDPLL